MKQEPAHKSSEILFSTLLGMVIRKRRLEAGLTQKELGERAGMDAGAVGKVERGNRALTFQMILQFAEALGVKASDICQEAEALEEEMARL